MKPATLVHSLTALLLAVACSALPAQAETRIVSSHALQIDTDQPFPSIMYSDILKSMSDQVVWETGQIRFAERVRMTFLPEFNDPQHIAPYNASTGAFLTSQLTDNSGTVLQTVFWEARKDRHPFWTVSAVGNSNPQALQAGDYQWTWQIDGVPFWQLDFSIEQGAAASAYDQPRTYLEGPWSDWAYLYVPNGNLAQAPTFNFFLRDRSATMGNWVDTQIKVELLRNGELIAQHGHDQPSQQRAKPWWVAQELALRRADHSGFLPASEMVKAGDYELRLSLNGEVHARYHYSADGRLPFKGRQDRETAIPMQYLEGGQDRFYLKRQ